MVEYLDPIWRRIQDRARGTQMRHRFALSIAIGLLSGCATTHYQNTAHPSYGDTEYNNDLAQCRKENSTTTTTQGYDVQIHVDVDEAKAASCMTSRGWQPASK
jgi:uncharacterized protein YceK